MGKKVVIIDYGMGNHFSIYKKLNALGVNTIISSSSKDINNSDKIILPGVGNFKKAMENINQLNLFGPLQENVLIKKKHTLGICLGMQLMAKYSQEGNCNGLGWIDCNVEKINVTDSIRFKVPHTGWNSLEYISNNPFMRKIDVDSEFYFVHSYCIKSLKESEILSRTRYENSFISGFNKENIFGVQFHPEKSHDSGEILLKNFLKT